MAELTTVSRPGPGRLAMVAAVALALGVGVAACADGSAEIGGEGVRPSGAEAQSAPPERAPLASRNREQLPVDWKLFREKVTWAWDAGVDTLPMGDAVARIGESFLGTPYEPHTLELPGPERLVINFEALDCVTFVENVLALTRFVKRFSPEVLEDPGYRDLYATILTGIRYREGRVEGYASRLHYFSEWMARNEARGLLRDLTGELGGIPDAEGVDFMSTHPGAYAALRDDSAAVEEIRAVERRLSEEGRLVIPEDRIAGVSERIRDGDVIAATSTVPGLDVAHTGIALWRDGALHLLHAPLVGKDVQISASPLAERILRIDSQDGIMVARPLAPEE